MPLDGPPADRGGGADLERSREMPRCQMPPGFRPVASRARGALACLGMCELTNPNWRAGVARCSGWFRARAAPPHPKANGARCQLGCVCALLAWLFACVFCAFGRSAPTASQCPLINLQLACMLLGLIMPATCSYPCMPFGISTTAPCTKGALMSETPQVRVSSIEACGPT